MLPMKIAKKIAAFVLAAQMMLFSTPSVIANDDVWQGVTEDSIQLQSLLPYKDTESLSVTLQNEKLVYNSDGEAGFYVRDILPTTVTLGISGDFKIMFSNKNESYKKVALDDIITVSDMELSSNGEYKYGYIYFNVGSTAEDQLDTSDTVHYSVSVSYTPAIYTLLNGAEFKLYDDKGTEIQQYGESTNIYYDDSSTITTYVKSEQFDYDKTAMLKLTLPEGFSSANVSVYETDGYRDTTEIRDITAEILGNGYAVDYYGNAYLLIKITDANGNTEAITVWFDVNIIKNSCSIYIEDYDYDTFDFVDTTDYSGASYSTYCRIKEADKFPDTISVYASFKCYNFDSENYYNDDTKIKCAYLGYYESEEAAQAAGATNIKDELFGISYKVNLSGISETKGKLNDTAEVRMKNITITAIDELGVAYHTGTTIGIVPVGTGIAAGEEDEPDLSDNTYLSIYGATPVAVESLDDYYDNDYNRYKVSSDDDSYCKNGYHTVFILGADNQPVTDSVIYPYFYADETVRVYANGIEQNTGKSPINFKSGEAIQYAVSAENKENLANYWVTFLTQQQGAKLFVNAANSEKTDSGVPKREIFLNSTYDYKHDILFANVGNESLTGINVSLSEDTYGVKLDPYWTIIDSSAKQLNPFTTTSSSKIDNIAKVRLVAEDPDSFTGISGTLTISTANGGTETIQLTGIAGVPKIVTESLYDGVKYVPYSHVIMTNNKYGDDAIKFSLADGKLPKGIALMPNGELYGIPLETGEFEFTVKAYYNGNTKLNISEYTDTKTFTMIIKENNDENVDAVNADEQGYELHEKVSKYVTVYYNGTESPNESVGEGIVGDDEVIEDAVAEEGIESEGDIIEEEITEEVGGSSDSEILGKYPIIDRIEVDSDLFWSEGSYSNEFIDFYIDGIKLAENADYSAEEGSTKIIVRAQTFSHIAITDDDVAHTLAGEFRTNNKTDELRRSAQNVYIKYVEVDDDAADDDKTESPDQDTGNNNNGNTGGNTGSNTGTPNGTVRPIVQPINNNKTVNAEFTIIDAEGKPVSDLEVELHSTPMYASTDKNGTVKFKDVEFGKHTLYVTNKQTGKKISKSFTLKEGKETEISDKVITVKDTDNVLVSVIYDGKKLAFVTGSVNDIAAGAGMHDMGNVAYEGSAQHIGIIFIALAAAAAVSIGRRKARSKK